MIHSFVYPLYPVLDERLGVFRSWGVHWSIPIPFNPAGVPLEIFAEGLRARTDARRLVKAPEGRRAGGVQGRACTLGMTVLG